MLMECLSTGKEFGRADMITSNTHRVQYGTSPEKKGEHMDATSVKKNTFFNKKLIFLGQKYPIKRTPLNP